jgi:hypothetical protein
VATETRQELGHPAAGRSRTRACRHLQPRGQPRARPITAELAAAVIETIATAVMNAMWVAVAQIPSGSPSNTARPHAHAPASAVGSHFAVSRAMHGPMMSRPMSIRWWPVAASMAAITAAVIMLAAHSRRTGHFGSSDARREAGTASAGLGGSWPFGEISVAASVPN